jgi:hypothetical protein
MQKIEDFSAAWGAALLTADPLVAQYHGPVRLV